MLITLKMVFDLLNVQRFSYLLASSYNNFILLFVGCIPCAHPKPMIQCMPWLKNYSLSPSYADHCLHHLPSYAKVLSYSSTP